MLDDADFKRRAANIKLLLLDCDGVLTDGIITYTGDADEQKNFHVRDGHGIVMWHRAGLRSGVISGRTSSLVTRRAAELGISYVRQGTWQKERDWQEVLDEAKVADEETVYVGDDVTDIPLMRRAGLSFAVADATLDTKQAAHITTTLPGGRGAVREVIELILRARGQWQELVRRYTE